MFENLSQKVYNFSMNKKVLVTLSLGILSFVLLVLTSVNATLGTISTIFSLIGSFIGIWCLFSLLFKTLVLNKKEKLYLFGGTFVSLLSFGLGRNGFMLFFWLPGAVVSIFFLRSLMSFLNKTTSAVMNPLQDKITKMEEELKQKDSN